MKAHGTSCTTSCVFAFSFLLGSFLLAGCGGGGGAASSSSSAGNTQAVPKVSSISPTSVPAGSGPLTLTVNGTGFVSTTIIQVGGVAEPTTYVSSKQVTATVTSQQIMSGALLSVVAVNGTSSSGSTTTSIHLQVDNPLPTITSLAPAVTMIGTPQTITVNGTGFLPTTVIDVNATVRTTTYVSATQVAVTLTAADVSTANSLSLTAINAPPGGGTSSTATFAVSNPAPTVSSLEPRVAVIGVGSPTISIAGTNFLADSIVQINGTAVATTFVSPTRLTFSIANQTVAQVEAITVSNPAPGGGITTAGDLLVLLPQSTPVISSVSPSQINAGSLASTLYVVGTNLTEPIAGYPDVATGTVLWNGTPLTTSNIGNDSQALLAQVPASLLASAGTATITVSSETSTPAISNALTFTISNPPVPTLTSIYPSSGPINTATTVSLKGSNFTGNSTVAMNGTNLPVTFVNSGELTVSVPALGVALPGNVNFTVTTPAPGGGSTAPLPYTAYIAIPNNGMAYNPVNGLLYISVPGSAGAPYGNSVVSVDPETGALGTPIYVGSEPDQLAISSDGTTLWVGLDGASAVRKVNLTTGTAGMQFSFNNNSGTYAFPPVAHAIGVLPGSPNSIVVSSAVNPDLYTDGLAIYDSGVRRTNSIDLSSISSLPAIFINPAKAEIYATSYETGYQVLSYNATGLQNLAGNTGTNNYQEPYGRAVQVDNGVAYLDSGMALNAETGALLGTFYSSGTTVATGPMVSDSKLGKLFILENANPFGTSTSIQAFNESNFTPISSATLPVNGALAGGKWGSSYSTQTEFDGSNLINTMVRWGADGLAFRAANGVFSFRTSIVQDLSTVSADLGVTIVSSGSLITGANTTYKATIKNSGPSASTSIALTGIAPTTGILVSSTSSSGSCSTSGVFSCNLGRLSSGASATVTFIVSQKTAGGSTLSVKVAGSENDPIPANNQASSTVIVTGSDYNPVPTIASVEPAAILAGSSDTQISVTGAGFTNTSSILLAGISLPTNVVSSTQLTAVVPAADLTNLGWSTISVATPGPGGGNTAALPLSIFNVISLKANHILYDPYSRKIMASVASDSTTVAGNSIVAITPETSTVGKPVAIGSQPTNMALTSDGQLLYTILSGSNSVALFNMLTQTPAFTYAIQPGTGTDTDPAPRGIATQPGTENMVGIDLGSWAGSALYAFDLKNKTAAMVGQNSGPYSGSCIAFLDSGNMLSVDTDTTGATFDHYTVTSSGFTSFNYSTSSLNEFGCFKLSGGLAFGIGGGVANPATSPATQVGLFPVNGGGEFNANTTLAPDASLQSTFYLVNTESEGTSNAGDPVDGIQSFNQNTFLPTGSLNLNMGAIEGNISYAGLDLIRWGQDGLALLMPGGHIFLVRGAFVVPQMLKDKHRGKSDIEFGNVNRAWRGKYAAHSHGNEFHSGHGSNLERKLSHNDDRKPDPSDCRDSRQRSIGYR